MSLQNFITEVKTNGLAKANRFTVSFGLPRAVVTSTPRDVQQAHLLCDGVQLPGLNYSTIQNRTFGEFREVPYERLYDPVTFSFYVDKQFKVKHLFDQWMGSIQNPTARTFNYYENYVVDIYVTALDELNQPRYQIKLAEAYPKTISSISMDQSSKDIIKLQVTMQYKYWRHYMFVPGGVNEAFYRGTPNEQTTSESNVLQVAPTAYTDKLGIGEQPGTLWDDVKEWLGNPTIPDFNVQDFDLSRLNPF
jgi:hypothetical protein